MIKSISAQAASERYECKISKRLDESSKAWSKELQKDVGISSYEDVNDFVFEDYPWLLIESVADGWEVNVGAMEYGAGEFFSEPQTIVKSVRGGIVHFSYGSPESINN